MKKRRSRGPAPKRPRAIIRGGTEEILERLEGRVEQWRAEPVRFVMEALDAEPEPWQCDVLDALQEHDSVAIRACHGVGKTAVLAWVTIHFLLTRPCARIPTTAPTLRQVKEILWGEIHRWWHAASGKIPWLTQQFELQRTRLGFIDRPAEWFALGVASAEAYNIEGFHAQHLLAIVDEAKGVPHATWQALHGMRTTDHAKILAASTPGGPGGEFHKVFTRYRATWKSLFVIHPEPLRQRLGRPAAPYHSSSGTYYSARIRAEWVRERELEWGIDSPVYTARVIGDFPDIADDVLIPYSHLSEAEDRESGASGERWVACDVARYGRDRTVILVGEGGTLLHGEVVGRTVMESTAAESRRVGVGHDPRRPRFRALTRTAEICCRLRAQYNARGIIVDETGVGAGLVDILKDLREPVKPINFGGSPTDKPADAEALAYRRQQRRLDTRFVNVKAQLGWALRGAFEEGWIALNRLPRPIRDALIAQASLVRYEFDAVGHIRVIDPDDQDELALAAGNVEGRRSPDHFHALLLYWACAGNALRRQAPSVRTRLPKGVRALGHGEPWSGAVRPRPSSQWIPAPFGLSTGAVGGFSTRAVGGQAKYICGGWFA